MAGANNIFRSPLRYPGGKTCIYKFMTSLLEENDMVGTNYAEPYAGGAGLALRLMMDEYVNNIFINDLDPSIYAFWYVAINNPDDLCRWIETVEINVQQWEKYKEVQRNYKTADVLELAKSTFFLNRTNVSGVISGGPIGGLDQKGKYKIDVMNALKEKGVSTYTLRKERTLSESTLQKLRRKQGVIGILELVRVQ